MDEFSVPTEAPVARNVFFIGELSDRLAGLVDIVKQVEMTAVCPCMAC